MEAVFGSVAAVLISVPYGRNVIKKQQQLIIDQGERIELLEDQMLDVEKNVDERLTQFDLETGTKMVRVVTPIAQATKKLQEAVGL